MLREAIMKIDTHSSYKQGSRMGWQKLFGELSIEQMLKHRGRKEKGKKGRQVKMENKG